MSPKKKNPVKKFANKEVESETELYNRLFNKVAEYFFRHYRENVEDLIISDWDGVFGDRGDIQNSPFADVFFDWMIHAGGIFDMEQSSIEIFLEKKRLTDAERGMLMKMNASVISLFEITVSETRDSVLYQDLLLGGEFFVDELNVTTEKKYGLIAGRRLVLDGELTVGFGYYPFNHELKDEILEEIGDNFGIFRKNNPDSNMEQFLRCIDPLPDIWLDGFENDENQDLDYLPEVMQSAIYQINGSRKKVLEKLRTISSLEEMEGNETLFVWVDDGEGEQQDQRGVVAVSNDLLILGAFTPELRDAGKIMLHSACSGLIQHLRDMEFDTKSLYGSPEEME